MFALPQRTSRTAVAPTVHCGCGWLEHCPPHAFAQAFSSPLLLSLQTSPFSARPRSAGEIGASTRACSSQTCPLLRPRRGHPQRQADDFQGAGRLSTHRAPVMLAQDPVRLATILNRGRVAEDGSRWPRRSSCNVANAHPEGDVNLVLARALSLGGRAVDLWFACALHTHRRP